MQSLLFLNKLYKIRLFRERGKALKYKKVEEYIKSKIEDGELSVGDQIESEEELSQKFGISRLTVNKALVNLMKEGYLNRVKGKGTFVKAKLWNNQANRRRYNSLSEDIRNQGKVPGSKLIEYKVISGKEVPEIAKIFAISETDLIHYIVRVRTADQIAIAISYSYISVREVPYIDVNVLENGSLWEFLAKRGFEGTKRGYHVMKAVMPTEEQIKLLEISPQTPLLCSHHISIMEKGTVYNYVDTYYVTDRYQYEYVTEVKDGSAIAKS